jgi:hypothetical protein
MRVVFHALPAQAEVDTGEAGDPLRDRYGFLLWLLVQSLIESFPPPLIGLPSPYTERPERLNQENDHEEA